MSEMRRFKVTYTRDDTSIDIEGVQFSNNMVTLEFYPDDEWEGARAFRDIDVMQYHLNEFGDAEIEWIDKENGKVAIVGEPGPTLVCIPSGSSVYPNSNVTIQPPSGSTVVTWNMRTEEQLRVMVREMVAEALAKPPKPQPVEDAIVNYTCEVCGENYVGLFSNVKGWYGIVEQGTWERLEPRKEYAFCSEEHMGQWKTGRGLQV